MTVREIIKEYLEKNGYDGLCNDNECGCDLADLCPCGEIWQNCNAGYKKLKKEFSKDELEEYDGYDWIIYER